MLFCTGRYVRHGRLAFKRLFTFPKAQSINDRNHENCDDHPKYDGDCCHSIGFLCIPLPATIIGVTPHAARVRFVMCKMCDPAVSACRIGPHPTMTGRATFDPVFVEPQGVFKANPGPHPSHADLTEHRKHNVGHTRQYDRLPWEQWIGVILAGLVMLGGSIQLIFLQNHLARTRRVIDKKDDEAWKRGASALYSLVAALVISTVVVAYYIAWRSGPH